VELAWNEVISLWYRPLVLLTDNVDQHNILILAVCLHIEAGYLLFLKNSVDD